MSSLKLSMACWQVAVESATRRKIAAAKKMGVPISTGGGPFEVAAHFSKVDEYLDLCAELGVTRIEAGEGFIKTGLDPSAIVALAQSRGLEVQYEVGEKHSGALTPEGLQEVIEIGRSWLDAGAKQLVVEARESASNVGLFDAQGSLNLGAADRLAETFGLSALVFEAPNKPSQFAFMRHFGPEVELCNVRLEEVLRVEIYRRGLHSDAFQHEVLRPRGPK